MSSDAPTIKKCVICKKTFTEDTFIPFCSRACKLRDLNRWLTGYYAVPTDEAPDTEKDDD